MKDYCHNQLVHVLPLYIVKNEEDYFHWSRDGKKKIVGICHHSRKVRAS